MTTWTKELLTFDLTPYGKPDLKTLSSTRFIEPNNYYMKKQWSSVGATFYRDLQTDSNAVSSMTDRVNKTLVVSRLEDLIVSKGMDLTASTADPIPLLGHQRSLAYATISPYTHGSPLRPVLGYQTNGKVCSGVEYPELGMLRRFVVVNQFCAPYASNELPMAPWLLDDYIYPEGKEGGQKYVMACNVLHLMYTHDDRGKFSRITNNLRFGLSSQNLSKSDMAIWVQALESITCMIQKYLVDPVLTIVHMVKIQGVSDPNIDSIVKDLLKRSSVTALYTDTLKSPEGIRDNLRNLIHCVYELQFDLSRWNDLKSSLLSRLIVKELHANLHVMAFEEDGTFASIRAFERLSKKNDGKAQVNPTGKNNNYGNRKNKFIPDLSNYPVPWMDGQYFVPNFPPQFRPSTPRPRTPSGGRKPWQKDKNPKNPKPQPPVDSKKNGQAGGGKNDFSPVVWKRT